LFILTRKIGKSRENRLFSGSFGTGSRRFEEQKMLKNRIIKPFVNWCRNILRNAQTQNIYIEMQLWNMMKWK